MTIPELIKDFIDTSKERLKTPISGAFLWSFIIYNWRPIILLLFSDASIENKIIVINHEYCSFWTIFIPVFISLFYTLLLPKIMLAIDNDLEETKIKRIDNIYNIRTHTMERKIVIAEQDFFLKNAESGNKDRQELLDQIESMKASHEQIRLTDKNRIESLNVALKEVNDLATHLTNENRKLIRANKDPLLLFAEELTDEERSELLKYNRFTDEWIFENFSPDLQRKLVSNKMVVLPPEAQQWEISKKGIDFINLLEIL